MSPELGTVFFKPADVRAPTPIGTSRTTWATRFLLGGGTDAIVNVQAGRLVPIQFRDLIDEATDRIRIRYVDVASDTYRTLLAYMVRLTRKDIEEPESLRALARAGALSEAAFVERSATSSGGRRNALKDGLCGGPVGTRVGPVIIL